MNNKLFFSFLALLAVVILMDHNGFAQGAEYPTISKSKVVLVGDSGQWDYNKVHTLSVIEANKDGYKYWGYYGLSYYGGDLALRKAGLVRSNDLVHWVKYEGNPIIQSDCRWPTVLLDDSTFYMFYAEYNSDNDSRIVMLTSKDGIHFYNKEVVVKRVVGTQNQNPFIYYNKQDGYYYLAYYHGVERSNENELKKYWQIRIRKSRTIEGLKNSKHVTLLTSSFTIASPSIAYYNGKYYLLIEAIKEGRWDNKWVTLAYESKNIAGKYLKLNKNPLLANDDACAFQYVLDGELYIFYSHCLNLKEWNWELKSVKVIK